MEIGRHVAWSTNNVKVDSGKFGVNREITGKFGVNMRITEKIGVNMGITEKN